MPAEVLGTWPITAGTGIEGGSWREEGWSIVENELRRFLTTQTI